MSDLRSFDPPTVVEQAIYIATVAHMGQRDRQGEPYITHPLRVMYAVASAKDYVMTAAAVLHDVFEDCEETYHEMIRDKMPMRVVHLVTILSHFKDEEYYKNRDRSYRLYVEQLASDTQAKTIKLADLTDNLFHPARRRGWVGHEQGKRRYLDSYFFLTDGDEWPKRYR